MSEDLQSLLEKINREGVEKARKTADGIIAEAKAKAAAIVKSANEEAAKAKADADAAAKDYAERAKETIGQGARDTLLKIREAVTSLLENTLTKDVEQALADEKNVAALTMEAVKGLVGGAEVAVPARFAATVKAQLASRPDLTVITDETMSTGFSVRLDGGRVEHSFTLEAIAGELSKRLRPDLAKLLG